MANRIMKHLLLGIEIEKGIYYYIDENGFIVDIRGSNEEINSKKVDKRKYNRGIDFYRRNK